MDFTLNALSWRSTLLRSRTLSHDDHMSLLVILDEALDEVFAGAIDREVFLRAIGRIMHFVDINDRQAIQDWLHQRDLEKFREHDSTKLLN